MEHKMILMDADLKSVYARLAKRFQAPEAQMVERDTRNVEDAVRFRAGAPVEREVA